MAPARVILLTGIGTGVAVLAIVVSAAFAPPMLWEVIAWAATTMVWVAAAVMGWRLAESQRALILQLTAPPSPPVNTIEGE